MTDGSHPAYDLVELGKLLAALAESAAAINLEMATKARHARGATT
jgi:hypothetical protein